MMLLEDKCFYSRGFNTGYYGFKLTCWLEGPLALPRSGCQELRVLLRHRQCYHVCVCLQLCECWVRSLGHIDDCRSVEVTELHQFTPVGDVAHSATCLPLAARGKVSFWSLQKPPA